MFSITRSFLFNFHENVLEKINRRNIKLSMLGMKNMTKQRGNYIK